MGIGERDEQGRRKMIVSFKQYNSSIDDEIYVQILKINDKIIARAYSSKLFESPLKEYNEMNYDNNYNYNGKKKLMDYDEFIETLAVLNGCEVEDRTFREGLSAVEGITQLEKFIRQPPTSSFSL